MPRAKQVKNRKSLNYYLISGAVYNYIRNEESIARQDEVTRPYEARNREKAILLAYRDGLKIDEVLRSYN